MPSEPEFSLGALVAACRDLANRSNRIISTIYEGGKLDVIDKAFDNKKLSEEQDILKAKDPTTIADILAQKLIVGSLKNLYPLLTICGEEGDLKVEDKYTCKPNTILEENIKIPNIYNNIDIKDITVWVDPIDGTKEYTEGIKEAVTTLIGISYKERPIAGIISRPFTGQIVWGIVGLGAFGFDNENYPIEKRNKSRRIICTTRSHFEPHMKAYISACEPTSFVRAGGSGGKVLMIVEGIADAYVFPSLGTKRWDTCACEAILIALGGKLTKPDGTLYNYSASQIKNPMNEEGFIATLFGNNYHENFLQQNLTIEQLDMVIFGATGFTGKICAEYVVEKYSDSNYKFGLAGRDKNKLQEVLNNLTKTNQNSDKMFELIVCNSQNMNDVEKLVRKTNVVITTVGPYSKYGENLIKACCKYGVDYVDLTGEFPWVKRMILKYNDDAIRGHARIVNFGGFVSTPMDCGLRGVIDYMKKNMNINPKEDELRVRCDTMIKGGAMSGGTTESWFEMLRETTSASNMNDPYCLIPEDQNYGPKQPERSKPRYDKYYKKYTMPSTYGAVDRIVVCRSNALLNNEYGQNMQMEYSTFMTNSFIIAWLVHLMSVIIQFLLQYSLGKKLLSSLRPLLPQPGNGPDKDSMLKSTWETYVHVTSNKTGKTAQCLIHAVGDPGYWNTARILVEEGLFFADQRRNPKLKHIPGGFMTPAAAFGKDILDRLKTKPGTMMVEIGERKAK